MCLPWCIFHTVQIQTNVPYLRMTYGPPFLEKHGDAFQQSFPCDIPPHTLAPPRPRRGWMYNIPHFWDSKRLQYSVPRNLVRSADCHRVLPKSFYAGLGMVRYVLLRKYLGTILSILPTPNDNTLAWNWAQRRQLRLPKTFQLRRPAKSVPVAPFGDWRLPLFPISSNGNWHSQLAPWLTPLRFRKYSLNPEGEDQGGDTP